MKIVLAILVLLFSIWQFYDSFNKTPETAMDRAMKFRGFCLGIIGIILFYFLWFGKLNIN
jgi:hypothetical protein